MTVPSDASVMETPDPEDFARELTELCRKHGLALAGMPTLFIMEYDDYALHYAVNAEGQLVLS
jgi:hypothetical protein